MKSINELTAEMKADKAIMKAAKARIRQSKRAIYAAKGTEIAKRNAKPGTEMVVYTGEITIEYVQIDVEREVEGEFISLDETVEHMQAERAARYISKFDADVTTKEYKHIQAAIEIVRPYYEAVFMADDEVEKAAAWAEYDCDIILDFDYDNVSDEDLKAAQEMVKDEQWFKDSQASIKATREKLAEWEKEEAEWDAGQSERDAKDAIMKAKLADLGIEVSW